MARHGEQFSAHHAKIFSTRHGKQTSARHGTFSWLVMAKILRLVMAKIFRFVMAKKEHDNLAPNSLKKNLQFLLVSCCYSFAKHVANAKIVQTHSKVFQNF